MLAIIGRLGTGGGIGHVIEYRVSAIKGSIHGGPDDGLQHVDRGGRAVRGWLRRTIRLSPTSRGAQTCPKGAIWGAAPRLLALACRPTTHCCVLTSRSKSTRAPLAPHVTWGTNPGQVVRPRPGGAGPGQFFRARELANRGERALGLHGPPSGDPDARSQSGHGVYRVLYQRPDRRPTPSCLRPRWADGRPRASGTGGTRFGTDQI